MQRETQFIEGEEHYKHGYWQQPAPQEAVDVITNAPIESDTEHDGRSVWMWIRLPDGDLVLAVYPQGDTYFNTEHLRTI